MLDESGQNHLAFAGIPILPPANFLQMLEDADERFTINIPDAVFERARIKAVREDVTVSEVLRDLLARWVAGEIKLTSEERSREELVALARAARGMWADRDPDAYLAASRTGLKESDE